MCRQFLVIVFLVFCAIMPITAQNTYTNPVFRADFPDPSVQRDIDGTFYAYATGPNCLKSKDLINWQSVSRVIDRPTWNDTTYVNSKGEKKTDYYSFWACDVSHVEDKYVMYYACALWGNGSRTGIGVASGNSLKKFEDNGKMFRSTEIGVENSIDPVYWEEKDKKYLAWGSFNGIYISQLTDDGLKLKNPAIKTRIAGTAFEGAMIHKRGNYYYLFCSVGSCCDGVNSTYHAVVGRSNKLTGPYYDKNGGQMLNNCYTTIIRANNRWRAPGHNSEIITDDNGDDWLLYHAIDTEAPDDGRMMLLDKITWVNGWPTVNDGTPSTTPQAAPVFYNGDGANVGYKFRNLDLTKRAFKHWDITKSDDCKPVSGEENNYYTVGYVTDSGTFDISQTATDVPNGLYEMRMDALDTEYNVEAYVNGTTENIHNATQPEDLPTTIYAVCTQFNRGTFTRSFYGFVADGKLKIGVRSKNSLASGEKFYIGNIQVIYREKNATALAPVLESYYLKIDSAIARKEKYYSGYSTSITNCRSIAESSNDNDVRYTKLLDIHNLLDSIDTSVELYDSLEKKIKWMEGEIEKAVAGGYYSVEAQALYEKANSIYKQCSGSNEEIIELFGNMEDGVSNMISSFNQGDGTAGNPYIISRHQQMAQMHKVLISEHIIHFAMDADIDMSGYMWEPLNTLNNKYRYWINFDGRGHIIRNLTSSSTDGFPSFFGALCGECRNVGFVDANITGETSCAGILCGSMGHVSFTDENGNPYPVIVENCYFTGSVDASGYVGVVSGTMNASPIIIRNVYTAAEVTGRTNRKNCGGIIGRVNSALTIENCYSADSIKASPAAAIAGGGQANDTPASKYNNVIAWNMAIDGSYSTSKVSSFAFTAEGDTLINTYSFSQMKLNGETITDGKSHEELQRIVTTWGSPWHSDPAAGNGYPILQWQYERGDYREICGFTGTTNDIKQIDVSGKTSGKVYDLKGRETTPTKGIYIIDGKKKLY
ncbi:MAG: family 43 glycosylhydrolase [Bacteroidaceae bacterium]|nr:family 43 glycosylhydrolase [Bacteroidaceae bacterium]